MAFGGPGKGLYIDFVLSIQMCLFVKIHIGFDESSHMIFVLF